MKGTNSQFEKKLDEIAENVINQSGLSTQTQSSA
jgi:hypothetical protein